VTVVKGKAAAQPDECQRLDAAIARLQELAVRP